MVEDPLLCDLERWLVFGEPLERDAEDEVRSFSCGLLAGDGDARPDILCNCATSNREIDVGLLIAVRVSAEVCDKVCGRLLRR